MTPTTHAQRIWTTTVRLGLGGASAFWVTTFAISLTPVAAEYRTALGISYLPMLGEALLAGLIIGFGVSFSLLRFYRRLPTDSPILKAVLLSLIVLIVATILVEIPPRLFTTTSTDLQYVLIGAAFNTLRCLALGVVSAICTADPPDPNAPQHRRQIPRSRRPEPRPRRVTRAPPVPGRIDRLERGFLGGH